MRFWGERIRLRFFRKGDVKQLAKLAHDKSVARFTHIPYPYRLKNAKEFVSKRISDYRKKEPSEVAFVIERKEDGEFLGVVSLLRFNLPAGYGEMGYWLGRDFRGKGYMREAALLALGYAFKKLKLNRVEIQCAKNNLDSKRVIESLGAKFEGMLRERCRDADKRMDARMYSILRKEFGEWADEKA